MANKEIATEDVNKKAAIGAPVVQNRWGKEFEKLAEDNIEHIVACSAVQPLRRWSIEKLVWI